MSRLFLIFLGSVIFLMPPLTFAEEVPSEKAKIMALFKAYKVSLNVGDAEGALTSAEQMYALTPDAYGKTSKTHAAAAFNLAQLSAVLKHRQDTTRYYQEHIDILDRLGATEDRKYLWKLGLLSDAYNKAQKKDDAVAYALKALTLANKLKVSEELLADYELRMGINYYAHPYGKFNEAEGHFNRAFELRSKIHGNRHLATAEVVWWQANYYFNKGDYSQAVDCFGRVLAIYQDKLSPGDDRIKQVYLAFELMYYVMEDEANEKKFGQLLQKEFPATGSRDYSPILSAKPIYPRKALKRNLQGYVILDFIVDTKGGVKDVKVILSSNRIFNKAALKAVKKFRYRPRVKDGKPIETVNVRQKITFEIGY